MADFTEETGGSINATQKFEEPTALCDSGVHRVMLDLMQKLQTSLELETVLQLFTKSTGLLIGPINATYSAKDKNIAITGVEKARHKVNYNLRVESEPLGSIEFFKQERFTEAQLSTLESLLRLLIYPLKNALSYRDAVEAAMSDALTGAANKRAFDYQINHEAAISKRYQSNLSMAMIDIDFFKKINDQHGHAAGDAVLVELVKIINNNIRDSDALFRLGGEEFGLILSKTNPQDAFTISDRIRKAVAKNQFLYKGQSIALTISVGVSTHLLNESKANFIARADKALYAAKNSGRNNTATADLNAGQATLEESANETNAGTGEMSTKLQPLKHLGEISEEKQSGLANGKRKQNTN